MKGLARAFALFLMALVVVMVAIQFGSLDRWELAHPGNLSTVDPALLRSLRWPRVILAFVGGAILSASGLVFQVTLRNPLADPYLMGVSSGAMCGAIASIGIFHSGPATTSLFAFLGGLFGLWLSLTIAGPKRWFAPSLLVLGGAITTSFLSALATLSLSFVQTPDLPGILFWLGGDLSLASFAGARNVSLAAIPLMAFLFFRTRQLEILETGDAEARALGVNTKRLLLIAALTSTLATATAVSYIGIIGFLGLMIPHASRALFGPHLRLGAFGAILLGGVTLTLADLLARTALLSSELPVGAITAIVGCPFLIHFIRKTQS